MVSIDHEPSCNWAAQLLASWCAFLKSNVTMTLRPSDRGLCIYVRLRPLTPGVLPVPQIERCREALLLLSTLAAVDNSAFQDVLLHECACANLPLVVPAELAARFELRLGDSKDAALGFDTELYRAFFALSIRDSASSTSAMFVSSSVFAEAMDTIRARAATAQHSCLSSPCTVYVRLIPCRSLEVERVAHYLQSVEELMQGLQHTLEQGVSCMAQLPLFPFAVKKVELHISRLILTPNASVTLAQLLEREQPRVELYPSIELSATAAIGWLLPVDLARVFGAITGCSNALSSNSKSANRVVTTAPLTLRIDFSSESANRSSRNCRKYMQNIRALCSALTASRKIEELHIENLAAGAPANRTSECWQWLAYALLSKDSVSSVSALAIHDGYFRRKDARAVVRILEAMNPATALLRSQHGTEQEDDSDSDDDDGDEGDDEDAYAALVRQRERLDAHQIFGSVMMSRINEEYDDLAFPEDDDIDDGTASNASSEHQHEDASCDASYPVSVRVKPVAVAHFRESKHSLLALSLDPSAILRVMSDTNNNTDSTVDIIVPGVGQCSVPREAVDRLVSAEQSTAVTSAPLSSLSLGYRGSISSLSLCFTRPTDGDALLPLIAYMGPQLTALDLASEVGLTAVSLRAILQACPRLTTLAIPDVLRTAECELIAAYDEQLCRVSDLGIFQFEPSESTVELLRRLSDPTQRIAQCVRHLKLVPTELRAFPSATAAMLVDLFERNKTLESLKVRLSREVCETLEPELMRFHGERLASVKAPLPLASRVALLSVITALGSVSPCARVYDRKSLPHKQARREYHTAAAGFSLESFGSDPLALIFHFAAERVVREISIASL